MFLAEGFPMEAKGLKRTRVLNVKQSKHGCFTCKQRRIKCDEQRPSCLRCQRSKRVCTGYPAQSVSSHESSSTPSETVPSDHSSDTSADSPSALSLRKSLNLSPWSIGDERRYTDLTYKVLSSDPHHLHSPSSAAVFAYLLPQLSATTPLVSSAAAAFGAAYDSAILHNDDPGTRTANAKHYGQALQLMQQELQRPRDGHVPLLVASLLLAISETIQNRQNCALRHVLGAFSLLEVRDSEKDDLYRSPDASDSVSPQSKEEIDIIADVLRAVDVQIATFVWGKSPYLPREKLSATTLVSSKSEDLIKSQPLLIHACLHLVGKAARKDEIDFSTLPPEIIEERDTLVSWVRTWLASFDRLWKLEVTMLKSRLPPSEQRHLQVLKSQLLGVLVMISNMRERTQTCFDDYYTDFEETIKCAEFVLGQSNGYILKERTSALPPFNPSPGIIQPLFFLARKCRHSLLRRRAIALLRICGIEGPFNGDLEAAVATRIVEVEENRPFKPELADHEVLLPQDISDGKRVSSCWRIHDGNRQSFRQSIKLCRRIYSSDPSTSMYQDTLRWEIWEEHFSFSVASVGGYRIEPQFARDVSRHHACGPHCILHHPEKARLPRQWSSLPQTGGGQYDMKTTASPKEYFATKAAASEISLV